ncbi:MAG TPA: phosphatidate cytidylyltransferase [Terriglobia bacterium]|nr:phosphatidate cytidylyltransferase [Terriglobia bacterium]
MKTRVLTGIAILIPSIYLIGWSPQWLFLAVLVVLVERGVYEYILIARQSGFDVLPAIMYAAGAAVCIVRWPDFYRHGILLWALSWILLLLIPVWALRKSANLEQYLGSVSATLFGIFYVAFTFSCLFPLRFSGMASDLANGRQIVFFLFAVICVGDIFAYFTGRAFGRKSMSPRISPKKTREGALGGLAASVILGWVYARCFWQRGDWKIILLLAFLVAVAGQIGDLIESAMKRGAHLKDSGAILPGHGGLLDRVDSLLLGAPVLWLALTLRSYIH